MTLIRSSTATFGIVLAVGLTTACVDDPSATHLSAVIDTVDGVERLSYPAEPAGRMDWSLDTIAVLGDALAGDLYQFGQVGTGGLAADADGNLYVLDRQGKRVLKYGPDGEHRATFGREGQGPGELNQPMSLAVGPADTVWVADFSNGRFTGYPQDGGAARTVPLPGEDAIPGRRLAALDNGFISLFRPLVGITMRNGRPGATRGGEPEEGPPQRPLLLLDPDLEPLDTLWRSPEPPTDMVRLQVGENVMVTMASREFYAGLHWDELSDGGVVVSDSAAYALHLLAPDGAVTRIIARTPPPRATSDADRRLARDRLREEYRQGGGVPVGGRTPDEATQEELVRQQYEQMTFADLIPRVVDLRVDPADRIWVGVSEETPDRVERIDIYDRDGTLLGELREFPLPDVFLGPSRIGVLRQDELDVQQVVVLDITGQERTVAGGS